MPITDVIDLRGGYFTDVTTDLMKENELFSAENCTWKDGLVKRNGYTEYQSNDLTAFSGAKGMIRFWDPGQSKWFTVIALDTGSEVNFYQAETTTFSAIDNTFDWTTGEDVVFSAIEGKVIAVNGTDKPAIIYYDSGWTVENLEAYDVRTRENANLWMGQWDDSGTTTNFIDDTTAGQDSTATDFDLATASTNNDGFYISCDFTFNKIVVKNAVQFSGSPVAEYAYWNGSSWTTITPGTSPTWTAATGDKTIEFDFPLDADGQLLWETYSVTDPTAGVTGKYILRVRFTTAPTNTPTADYFEVSNTQYLTIVAADGRPQTCVVHNNIVYLAESNIVYFSDVNDPIGWELGKSQYFPEGGKTIERMVSHINSLVILKSDTIYKFDTTNYSNPVRSRPLSDVGTIAPRSPVLVGNYLFFVAKDGIYMWDGNQSVKVSKHIQSDVDGYTLETACGVLYKSEYWVCFPDDDEALVCDPDTYRRDMMGDGRVSWYKFTSYSVNELIWTRGAGDTELLLGMVDRSDPVVLKLDTTSQDTIDGSSSNITMTARTKYFGPGGFQREKGFVRVKYKIKEVSASTGSSHTLTLLSEDGDDTSSVTLSIPVGTRYETDYISVPYEMDGRNLSLELSHSGPTSSTLVGYSFSSVNRRF